MRKDLTHLSLVLMIVLGMYSEAISQQAIPADVNALLTKYVCVTCHKLDEKLIGPSYRELAAKSKGVKEMSALIYKPNPANWPGYPPMAPMPQLPKEDVKKIATWIMTLKNEEDE